MEAYAVANGDTSGCNPDLECIIDPSRLECPDRGACNGPKGRGGGVHCFQGDMEMTHSEHGAKGVTSQRTSFVSYNRFVIVSCGHQLLLGVIFRLLVVDFEDGGNRLRFESAERTSSRQTSVPYWQELTYFLLTAR